MGVTRDSITDIENHLVALRCPKCIFDYTAEKRKPEYLQKSHEAQEEINCANSHTLFGFMSGRHNALSNCSTFTLLIFEGIDPGGMGYETSTG